MNATDNCYTEDQKKFLSDDSVEILESCDLDENSPDKSLRRVTTRELICFLCGRAFCSQSRLLTHCSRVHQKACKLDQSSSLRCNICFRRFTHRRKLAVHRNLAHYNNASKLSKNSFDPTRPSTSAAACSACPDAGPAETMNDHSAARKITNSTDASAKRRHCPLCKVVLPNHAAFQMHLAAQHRDTYPQAAQCWRENIFQQQQQPPILGPPHQLITLMDKAMFPREELVSPATPGDKLTIQTAHVTTPLQSPRRLKPRRKPKPAYNSFGRISADGSNILSSINICEGIDVDKAAAEAGLLAVASGAPIPLDRKGRPCTFPCPACPRRFAFQCRLAAHLRCHTNIRPFLCPDCGRAFTQKGYLVRHAAVHKGERPFTCKICDRSYKHYGSLVNHKRTHGESDSSDSLTPPTMSKLQSRFSLPPSEMKQGLTAMNLHQPLQQQYLALPRTPQQNGNRKGQRRSKSGPNVNSMRGPVSQAANSLIQLGNNQQMQMALQTHQVMQLAAASQQALVQQQLSKVAVAVSSQHNKNNSNTNNNNNNLVPNGSGGLQQGQFGPGSHGSLLLPSKMDLMNAMQGIDATTNVFNSPFQWQSLASGNSAEQASGQQFDSGTYSGNNTPGNVRSDANSNALQLWSQSQAGGLLLPACYMPSFANSATQ